MSPYSKTNWVANVTPVTAVAMNNIESGIVAAPGTELAYAQWTAEITVSATTEAGATVLATCPAVTFDGSPVLIEAFMPYLQINSGKFAYFPVFLDGAAIGQIVIVGGISTAGVTLVPLYAARRYTPTAVSHTFSLRAYGDAASGAVAGAGVGGAGAVVPGFIRITRV